MPSLLSYNIAKSNIDLSFATHKVIEGRNKIHPYPAMLHPKLVDFLLDTYAEQGDVVLDPFCGSGVTLLQSGTRDYESVGFDINPTALLIAKVKTAQYDIPTLERDFQTLQKDILDNQNNTDIPEIHNIHYWYSGEVIKKLGTIRYILKNNRSVYKDFFVVCFAYVCRKQSLTRNSEFKRYRMQKEKVHLFQDTVFETYFNHLQTTIQEFAYSQRVKKQPSVLLKNSENTIPQAVKYDLIITSPPYGDSITTVAYGQYCSFGAEWIQGLNEFDNVPYKVDKESLGKKGDVNNEIYHHKILKNALSQIEKQCPKRAKDVLYFYNGYYNAIRNLVKNLNQQGKVCFVVGNRTVKGVEVPMYQITASFFEELGLKLQGIYSRNIVNKVMPLQNSPTNRIGKKSTTMLNEYIIVLKK